RRSSQRVKRWRSTTCWSLTNSISFFFKQKTAYEIGLGIPAEPLFRSKKPPRFGGMKTYNWEGVNPDGYFLDKLEPIPSALPSFQKLFQVSATALSIP